MDDAAVPRRVLEPPPGEVRAVPPFAVAPTGVGPYALGARLEEVLDLVPRGPRIELLRIEGVAEYNLVRSENGALLVGAPPKGAVAYVAVLDADIAKTADGVEVGVGEDALRESLGEPRRHLRRVADPRVIEFGALAGVRFVVERGRVVTMLVAPTDEGDAKIARPACRDGGDLTEARDALIAAARVEGAARVEFGCVTGDSPEGIVAAGDRVVLVGGEADKPKRLATARAPGVLYAAALDADGDGHDEIAVVSLGEERERRVAKVEILQWQGSKLVSILDEQPYEVSRRGAAWTGAQVNEVDLLIAVDANDERVRIGGVYLHSVSGRPREVAPLVERTYSLDKKREPKPQKSKAPAKSSGGAPDAEAPDEPAAPAPKQETP